MSVVGHHADHRGATDITMRHHGARAGRTRAALAGCIAMTQKQSDPALQIVEARRREMAIEHLLFGTIRFVAQQHPALLDELDDSLDHLWDKGPDGERDDEAVREVARRFIGSLRVER